VQHGLRETGRFRTEHQHVVLHERRLGEPRCAARRERKPARRGADGGATGIPVGVDGDFREIAVVEARAFQLTIFEVEAEWFDEVEACTSVGAEADDVPGVRWDFWGDEDDVEHGGREKGSLQASRLTLDGPPSVPSERFSFGAA
jgi:hypothetical protein